jgi:hypothetical protein
MHKYRNRYFTLLRGISRSRKYIITSRELLGWDHLWCGRDEQLNSWDERKVSKSTPRLSKKIVITPTGFLRNEGLIMLAKEKQPELPLPHKHHRSPTLQTSQPPTKHTTCINPFILSIKESFINPDLHNTNKHGNHRSEYLVPAHPHLYISYQWPFHL